VDRKAQPTKADLDAAAPDNPVILTRAGAHSAVCNSLAFQLANITHDTKDPESGINRARCVGRGQRRHPRTLRHRRAAVPADTFETLRPSYVDSLKALLPKGITSFHSASTGIGDEPAEGQPNRGRRQRSHLSTHARDL